MARFGLSDADNYGGQGGGGFFSLKNDRDTARVRFLYDSIDDVEGLAVHQVDVGDGKKRYVNCLREYGQPIDSCPLCAKSYPVQAKYFIPLFNIDKDRIETWERGRKFGAKLSSMCSRYPHLVSHIFEIERNGKAGDTQTTYEIYETADDDTKIEDFEIPNALGTIVLDKTADEMQTYLRTGNFPNDGTDEEPPRRRSSASDEAPTRRTPSTERGEAF